MSSGGAPGCGSEAAQAPDDVVRVLRRLQERYPEAGTRLHFEDRFQLLVAVVLSAQSTDVQVNRVTRRLFSLYRRPQDFAALEPAQLEPLVKGCGLYRAKARAIVGLSRALLERHGGQVPDSFEELLRLPGVGRKTANVMLSVGFDRPGLGVDTHVLRVSRRLGWHRCQGANAAEMALKALVPREWWSRAHHLLIAHGRAVCLARRPRCQGCPVRSDCPSATEQG
ncbi:MAG: endonuclease III [Syntrophomonadaceae bacterium]|jgi:endonuclease-3|nr:endonuclease III [Syntrophomonadaceae bacterium]